MLDYTRDRESELQSLEGMTAANDAEYRVTVTETANDGKYETAETSTYELGEYIEEQRDVMAAFFQAANDIQAETGISALDDEVKDLGYSDGKKIGGQFHKGSKKTELDKVVAESALRSHRGVEQFKQVSLHERIHKLAHTNAEKRGEPMLHIVSEEFEEAMCETATSLVTAKISAYKEYMGILEVVASKAKKSSAELARMYRDGKFTELNNMYMAAYPKKLKKVS